MAIPCVWMFARYSTRPAHSRYVRAKQVRFLQYRSFTGAQIRQAPGTDIDIDDA